MKRLESFLEKYSWLLESGIWIVLIIWAAQINTVFIAGYYDIKNQPPRNMDLELRMQKEVEILNDKQIEEAKAKGFLYSPRDYFDDLKKMDLFERESGLGYDAIIISSRKTAGKLQSMLMNNVGKGRNYDSHDLDAAANEYAQWTKRGGFDGDEFRSMLENMSTAEKIKVFSSWASKFYLKGFLLALFLFFIKMSKRKGILETILADKVRFLYSLILWPFFLFKYPHNVVKEIIVEAELRRIGNLFRKLTPYEKRLINEVAEGSGFWHWVRNFRLENNLIFERSFAVALVAVVIVSIFDPLSVDAGSNFESQARAGPEISYMNISNTHIVHAEYDQCTKVPWKIFGEAILFEEFFLGNYLRIVGEIEFFLRSIRNQDFLSKIEHVPINGYLFASFNFLLSK